MTDIREWNGGHHPPTCLGTILRKHESMEGEKRERTVKGRQVMSALKRVTKGRMEVNKVHKK